jgi:hypothetical protein
MIVDPKTVAEFLLEGAVMIHDRDGAVTPTTFAIGHARSIFAQPYDEDGYELRSEARTAMDALLISATGAICLGRIDESYIQERLITDPKPDFDELADRAETDPTIGTALTVQVINTRTRETTVALARLYLDDEGHPVWDRSLHDLVEGEAVVLSVEACAMAAGIKNPITNSQLKEELLAIGWSMIDSDDIRAFTEEEAE